MKREWLLLLGSAGVTLLLALGLIRWLAPGLLGITVPTDLQVVQLSEEAPSFFDNVFRAEDLSSRDFILKDPVTAIRQLPLLPEGLGGWNGPTDLLGFRNRAVPVVADVVAIGDSQTYGVNTLLDGTWPSFLERRLGPGRATVYNMSANGWGGVQYLDIVGKAAAFLPRVVVVAFYTGNDALESLRLAYQFAPWADLRQGERQPKAPPAAWPPQPADMWPVTFRDGVRTTFTAKARLAANDRDYPAIGEGYAIMAEAGRRISALAGERGMHAVFAIIPTKESVYAEKVRREGLEAPSEYTRLVAHEARNTAELARVLAGLPNATYVDLITPLSRAALTDTPLYTTGSDGHPIGAGYNAIAGTLALAVAPHVPPRPRDGLALIKMSTGPSVKVVLDGELVRSDDMKGGLFALIQGNRLSTFQSEALVTANGWSPGRHQVLSARDVAHLEYRGQISEVRPERYGPQAFAGR